MIRHAGLIAIRVSGHWRGVLIEGPSGSGKSDLALRGLDLGFRLVADDRVSLFLSRDRPFGRAAAPLAGLIESRGLGILRRDPLPFAEVCLVVRCAPAPESVPRMAEGNTDIVLGRRLPRLDLWPLEPAAPIKLREAIEHLGGAAQEGYQARFAPGGRRVGA
jgi:serine kinase of HPr protein (carbohydrate metabolism regulator)